MPGHSPTNCPRSDANLAPTRISGRALSLERSQGSDTKHKATSRHSIICLPRRNMKRGRQGRGRGHPNDQHAQAPRRRDWQCRPCGLDRHRRGRKSGEARVTGMSLTLSDNHVRGPHVPKKGLGNNPANQSKRRQDEPNTATERNTIFSGHSKPSECHRPKTT